MRPEDIQAGDAEEGLLDGQGDERLDFVGGEPRRLGLHHHLRRDELGEDVELGVLDRVEAEGQ